MSLLNDILELYDDLQIRIFNLKIMNIDKKKFLLSPPKCKTLIVFYSLLTSFVTFVLTIPTNTYVSIACAIIDFIQFSVFLFLIEQQMLYLYQSPELTQNGYVTKANAKYLLWLQESYMIGMSNGEKAKNYGKTALGFIIRKLMAFFTMRTGCRLVVINVLKQLFKWLGVIISHDFFEQYLDFMVCIVCALIAGLVSFWIFYPMCKNLQKSLSQFGGERLMLEYGEMIHT